MCKNPALCGLGLNSSSASLLLDQHNLILAVFMKGFKIVIYKIAEILEQ